MKSTHLLILGFALVAVAVVAVVALRPAPVQQRTTLLDYAKVWALL